MKNFSLFILVCIFFCNCEMQQNDTKPPVVQKTKPLENPTLIKEEKTSTTQISRERETPFTTPSIRQNKNKIFEEVKANITEGKALHPFPSENLLSNEP